MNVWAYIWVLLAAMLWGTTGTSQSLLNGDVHALTLGAFRLGVGGFALLAFVLMTKKMVWQGIPWGAAVLSALCMAFYQPLFFSAVQLTGIAVGTVVAIGSAPVLAGLIEWAVLRRMPNCIWAVATVLAITGCVLLFTSGRAAEVHSGGVLLALGAGFVFALYVIVSKRVLEVVDPVSATALVFSISALFLLPFLFFFDISYITEPKNLAVILYLGIGATSLAYVLFSAGLRKIPSSSAVTLSLAEPLTAAMLGVFFVGEALSGASWIGVLLLLGGIVALTFGKSGGGKQAAAES